MISILAGAATDAGRVRDHNEDSVLMATGLFAVADGIGGHAAGEVASELAVMRLGRLGNVADLGPESVRTHLATANQEILDSAAGDPARGGMGTTVAGLALSQLAGADHWVVFNVGDSRVYRFVQDELDLLTVDHTEVAELLASGAISEAEALRHPRRNVVTRALGTDPAPEVDLWILPPTPGERFVICSDGLTLEVTEDTIAAVLRSQPDAGLAARTLVRLALEAGGRDNVSVVVVNARMETGFGYDANPDDDTATIPRTPAAPGGAAR